MNQIKPPKACKMVKNGFTTAKDVLFMYVGSICTVYWSNNETMVGQLEFVQSFGSFYVYNKKTEQEFYGELSENDYRILIHLKHPADMPKEDKAEYKSLCHKIPGKPLNVTYCDTPQSLLWGIKNGYDMFDLIDTGEAIMIEPPFITPNVNP